ncbi:hypothetical protein [Lactiplantibacillus pentosus]|uniref:hypothetical protein n=1 Tax=Lactiplantibacillus pentosus TaxID=1589 RepID=UPI00132F7AAD|nr:hypothetical protein [Lactiplantibacillus pentosus]MBQ0835669.1 hypothetical protein [Lactiplantibacillus pentosus]MBU7464115.1 hypothetical protein [Lactiplantibacillus pentosus]MBU7490451.1 hypothetical protein [Lactiplantibacillus pentosus]MBU7492110.1 hypothetical protein [Lactiplantibacillus pentosus]MBU7518036.1 hypothetical protein [Lactiplantibacillus pentosus]
MLGLLMLAVPLIVSEWLVNRGLIPSYLQHRHIVWRALASLLVVVGLVAWWHLPVMITVVTTIYLATVIANRYLQAFEALERGKRE